jgi:3-oxo-5-alpha-steroid 4-dehydrogenase 1
MIEWIGWALATFSWAGLVFVLWTAANLVPRALKHHAWYRATFADYPRERKAIIPFIL